MTSIRKAALACVASAVLALPMSAAAQGLPNQDTFFTFSQSVELPNKTLPAGTYLFQLADSPSNRHIVKVMSQDRKEIHATLMAIPYYSTDRPSDDPQVRFMESPAQANGTNGTNGAAAGTNAIKIWFYPGNSVGHEFIYPRSQAMRIAARTGNSVLTTKSETEISETVADTDLTRVDRGGTDSSVDMSNRTTETTTDTQASTTQQQPVTEPARTTDTQTAQTQSQPMPERTAETPQTTPDRTAQTSQPMSDRTARTDTARTETTRTDLPNTAGFLPLLAVIGIGSLVGSRLLRRSRRV
jgi:hypothetical protein